MKTLIAAIITLMFILFMFQYTVKVRHTLFPEKTSPAEVNKKKHQCNQDKCIDPHYEGKE